jgi:hypothetical protein
MHNASRDHALGAERCIYATDAALASLSSCACVLNSGDGKWTCARGIASDEGMRSAATQWPSAMAVRAAITMTYEPGRGSTPRRAEPTTSRVSWGRYLLSVLDEQRRHGQNGTTCGLSRIALARSIALARRVALARRGAMT